MHGGASPGNAMNPMWELGQYTRNPWWVGFDAATENPVPWFRRQVKDLLIALGRYQLGRRDRKKIVRFLREMADKVEAWEDEPVKGDGGE